MKKERGITLIALVITIIVLLILAGVSISLVIGNNGVLNQATNAVSKNREAEALEDVQMAWASATSEYWTDWATDSNKNITDYRTKAKLDPYLVGKGHLEGEPRYNDTDKEYTVKYRAIDQNELYTFLITEDGKARKKTGVVLSNSELYILPGNTETLTIKFVDMEEGTITWTSSDTTSKITVTNDGVISVASGATAGTTATITATCNGKTDTCIVMVVELLANKSVGDYVNLNIGYLDQEYPSNDYRTDNKGKAWRILNKNATEGTVKLISTGIPLKFYHPSTDAALSVSELKTVENGTIVIKESGNRGYQSNGFTTNNIAGLFNNNSIFIGISLPVSSDFSGISQENSVRSVGDLYWLR